LAAVKVSIRESPNALTMDLPSKSQSTTAVAANLMTEGQIPVVSRETAQGLQHLHEHIFFIYCDIRSNNVLLSLSGDIKLSA